MTPAAWLLRWPMPALLAWAVAWLVFAGLQRIGLSAIPAFLVACLMAAVTSLLGGTWWRRIWIVAGFPLSLALLGAASLPAWAWLLPLGLLLLVYPLTAWRDAPVLPSPRNVLASLGDQVPLPAGARLLDAGCGLGDGLLALHDAYPVAALDGVERSWLLSRVCAARCPWARVRHGDMWVLDWRPYRMVYLFQRPESMARAAQKAQAEMVQGAWLISLDFPLPGVLPQAQLRGPGDHVVWIYRVMPGWQG
jgi:hypothetical protein